MSCGCGHEFKDVEGVQIFSAVGKLHCYSVLLS